MHGTIINQELSGETQSGFNFLLCFRDSYSDDEKNFSVDAKSGLNDVFTKDLILQMIIRESE